MSIRSARAAVDFYDDLLPKRQRGERESNSHSVVTRIACSTRARQTNIRLRPICDLRSGVPRSDIRLGKHGWLSVLRACTVNPE
jgi:hypothetical protein